MVFRKSWKTYKFFSCIFLFLISLFCLLNGEMGADEGIWNYIGRVWFQKNIPPYTGSVDNKTPLIYIIYGISNHFFGVNFLFPRIIALIFIVLSSLVVWEINNNIISNYSGIFSFWILGLTLNWQLLDAPFISTTEVFMIFFTSLSFLLILKFSLLKYTSFSIGILLGLAINFKQVALASFLVFFIYYLTNKNVLGSFFLTIGTILSTILICFLLYFKSIDFLQYFDGAWLSLTESGYPMSVWRIPKFFEKFWGTKIMLYYPFLILLFVGFYPIVKKINFFNLIALWGLFAFIGVNASGKYLGHQIIQIIPPLSILLGMSLFLILKKLEVNFWALFVSIFILFFPFNNFLNTFFTILGSEKPLYLSLYSQSKPNTIYHDAGLWLRKNTNTGDYIYNLGYSTWVSLAYSKRISASKYLNGGLMTDSKKIETKIVNDLKNKKPKLIVVEESQIEQNEVTQFIFNNYEKIKSFSSTLKVLKLNEKIKAQVPPRDASILVDL